MLQLNLRPPPSPFIQLLLLELGSRMIVRELVIGASRIAKEMVLAAVLLSAAHLRHAVFLHFLKQLYTDYPHGRGKLSRNLTISIGHRSIVSTSSESSVECGPRNIPDSPDSPEPCEARFTSVHNKFDYTDRFSPPIERNYPMEWTIKGI